jgi:hypothetical protein
MFGVANQNILIDAHAPRACQTWVVMDATPATHKSISFHGIHVFLLAMGLLFYTLPLVPFMKPVDTCSNWAANFAPSCGIAV